MTVLNAVSPRKPTKPKTAAEQVAVEWLLGYSNERTRSAYRSDLHHWWAWCAQHDLDPFEDVTRGHINAYARDLEIVGRARATVARRLATLSSLYRYAVVEGYLERNPVQHVRRPRVDDDSPTISLEPREAVALLDAAAAAGARDYALACLLILNGLRASQVCGLDVADVGDQRGDRTITITRKGATRATRALAPRTVTAVAAVIADRDHGPLLLDRHDHRLDRHDVARIVRRLARTVLPPDRADRITPHSLRHTAATIALDAGVPLHRVQDLLGHADPRTTRRYDRARTNLDHDATYALANHLTALTASNDAVAATGTTQ